MYLNNSKTGRWTNLHYDGRKHFPS